MTNRADDLAMLLSSDWFLQAWGTIGLTTAAKQRAAIQAGCRAIVRNVLTGVESHWEADFSPGRLERTASRVVALFDATHDDHNVIERLVHDDMASASSELDASLITNLVLLLISEYETNEELRAGVTPQLRDKVADAISEDEMEDFIVRLGSASTSEWDDRLRLATPGNPGHLLDVARELVRNVESFPKLWGRLHDLLSADEFSVLSSWLNSWAEKLAGKRALPS